MPSKICDGKNLSHNMHKTVSKDFPCGGACKPIISARSLDASEWYCEKCDRSYTVHPDDWAVLQQNMR